MYKTDSHAMPNCALSVLAPALVAVSLTLAFSTHSAHATPPGWKLTWSDEFEGTQVDLEKWDRINWNTPHNNEQQAYIESRATVADGNLVLTADDADHGGKSYTSGKVESKFTQQYGRWEIRAKLPGTKGTWPAIWLLPDTNTYHWPSQGEIDIMENRGDHPHMTSSAYHYGANPEARQFIFEEQRTTSSGQQDNYHDEFHTYAVEWDAKKIRFFVDDVHYQTISDEDTNGFLSSQTAPVEVNLNVAVGGDFVGDQQPDGSSVWPQQMLVDYVRVYEKAPSPPPAIFQNGSFEAQGGSLAGWSTFGNALPNIQTHHQATPVDGNETLKMFGQFNGNQNYSGVQQGITVSPGDSLSASASAMVLSSDDIIGGNTILMKFDYFSEFGGEYGSSTYLGSSSEMQIANADTANDAWQTHTLTDTAPAGAVEARLVFVYSQPGEDGGAIHIDNVSFINLDLDHSADADWDGDIDGTDFLSWQQNNGQSAGHGIATADFNFDSFVDSSDLAVWQQSYASLNQLTTTIVPEPSSQAIVAVASLLLLKSDSLLSTPNWRSTEIELR